MAKEEALQSRFLKDSNFFIYLEKKKKILYKFKNNGAILFDTRKNWKITENEWIINEKFRITMQNYFNGLTFKEIIEN